MNESNDRTERKWYECVCPECERKFGAHKSIAQEEFGIHYAGHATCKCGAFLNLTFDPDSETMIVKKWDDFIRESGLLQTEGNAQWQ